MKQSEKAGNDGVEGGLGGVKSDVAGGGGGIKAHRARLEDLKSDLASIRRDIAVLQEIVGVRCSKKQKAYK